MSWRCFVALCIAVVGPRDWSRGCFPHPEVDGKEMQGEQTIYEELVEKKSCSDWLFLTESSELQLGLILLTVLFNFGKDAWSPGMECTVYIIINQNII